MAPKAKEKTTELLQIDPIKRGRATVRIIGQTPLYFNSMSAKAQRDLLIGVPKKTEAQKRASLKHEDVFGEYRRSFYTHDAEETLLCLPSPTVKQAMIVAAKETGGIHGTNVARGIFLPQMTFPVWGKPFLKMDVVRQAGVARTPDVRTRGFLPEWCAEFDLAFARHNFSLWSVLTLIQNAGILSGIGDFRQERGAGSFGCFEIVGDDDEDAISRFEAVKAAGGRAIQQAAYDDPEPYSEHEAELLTAFERALAEKMSGDDDQPLLAAE